jgi:fructokinase
MDLTDKMVIVGLGEVLWDMLPSGKMLGGAPANFAYHVSQCGFPAVLVSAVGNDALGEEIRETLKEKGVESYLP